MASLLRPPGPQPRGIVGNFPMGSKDPLALYQAWAKQYGGIFYYRAINRHVYVLNEPELIKTVLLTNYQNFIKGEAVRHNSRIFGKGLLTNEGSDWLKQRRLIQPSFHRDMVASYARTIVAYTGRTLANWQDSASRDIHADMMRLGLEIVSKVLFNVEIKSDTDKVSVALNTIMELSAGGRMLVPPLLRLVPTPGNMRLLRAARQLDEVVYGLIRQRHLQKEVAPDLLYALLQTRDENGAPMSDKQLRDEVLTLLLAGHETTAVSLSWTWLLLAQHPEEEKRLWQELGEVLNGRDPSIEDLPRLQITERIIKEAMRLYPPVWALVRNPLRDCELGGYKVPAGSTVLMSQWVMHRDERFFAEPERFDPGRWLPERSQGMPKFAYFPFGGGPRSCIGASFAMMEAVLILATIAQRFQVKLEPGFRADPVPSITLRPNHGIKIVLAKRSAS